jgi:hypothetical protein
MVTEVLFIYCGIRDSCKGILSGLIYGGTLKENGHYLFLACRSFSCVQEIIGIDMMRCICAQERKRPARGGGGGGMGVTPQIFVHE